MISLVSDKNENEVLKRHALLALEYLKDPSVIEELPDLSEQKDLISQAFLSMCTELNPDNPKCLQYFISAIKRNDFHGRYGILALKKEASIKEFLKNFISDEDFRREFLDDTSILGERDRELLKNIKLFFNEDVKKLCKEVLVKAMHYNVAHSAEKSPFLIGLAELLREDEPGFILEIVQQIKDSPDGKTGLYFANNFLVEIVHEEDVPAYIDFMVSMGEKMSALHLMQRVKFSKRQDAEKIYESGRPKLIGEYKLWEEKLSQPDTSLKNREEELLKRFHLLLEPAPNQFSHEVFRFYNENKDKLDGLITLDQKKRLEGLITGTIFKFVDPINHELKITSQQDGSKTFTANASVFSFGHAIITAKHLGINITEFRQKIINFIPFAYHNELSAIFELVKNITPEELAPVIDIYKQKKSDLWRHQTDSFVEAVEQYHITSAVPILKELVRESVLDKYARQKAINVVDLLVPSPTFLKEIISLYGNSQNIEERKLSEIANGLLITSHADSDAIKWRLQEISKRDGPCIEKQGVHSIDDFEDEVRHSKTFAKPLMQLKKSGFEEDYLKLLDSAMIIEAKGMEFHVYASYLWEIVYSYFDNLKECRSYQPLQLLEKKIVEIKDKSGANWLAARMVNLRRSYLEFLGKPKNISEAIRKYNELNALKDKKILNSDDLFRNLQDALDSDLRNWIEGEGAYKLLIGEKVYEQKRQEYEKLVQRTLKTQVENILLKRGFEVDLIREPELLDGKKVDFFVRYGFIGPVIVEVKLSSNSDLKGNNINESPSYKNIQHYTQGYRATHGILLIINNDGTDEKHILKIKEIFCGIPKVWSISFNCDTNTVENS